MKTAATDMAPKCRRKPEAKPRYAVAVSAEAHAAVVEVAERVGCSASSVASIVLAHAHKLLLAAWMPARAAPVADGLGVTVEELTAFLARVGTEGGGHAA